MRFSTFSVQRRQLQAASRDGAAALLRRSAAATTPRSAASVSATGSLLYVQKTGVPVLKPLPRYVTAPFEKAPNVYPPMD